MRTLSELPPPPLGAPRPALAESKFAHRESTFFDNPRTNRQLGAQRVTVRACASAHDPACASLPRSHEVGLLALPSASQLRAALGPLTAKVLHLADARRAFGAFDSAADSRDYHQGAQQLLSSWCCTTDSRFKRIAGVVPYLLPPLAGQDAWRGDPTLAWAATALGEAFAEANQSSMAAELRAEVAQGKGKK